MSKTGPWAAIRPRFRPEQFGAVGDGEHDDTGAIGAAVRAALEHDGEVWLSPGSVYRVNVEPPLWLRGLLRGPGDR